MERYKLSSCSFTGDVIFALVLCSSAAYPSSSTHVIFSVALLPVPNSKPLFQIDVSLTRQLSSAVRQGLSEPGQQLPCPLPRSGETIEDA